MSKTSKNPEIPVPSSKEECSEAVSEIGRLQRERVRIETAMNDELARIKERYEAEAAPCGERIGLLVKGVRIFCEARRDELTDGGKSKTVALAAGELRWRVPPPKVVIRSPDAVMSALRRLGLQRFIRTKEEISKEALLLEPEAVQQIRGISISQKEQLVIVPFESQLEEVV